MNTSDMHPFIHPLSAAVDPAWESKSDWEIYKGIASVFSEVCVGHLGQETDVGVYTRSSMIPRRNWRSHLIFSTGVKASANLFRQNRPPISS
ncbi:respiratory nitrate reductase 2 subunit alpha [Salmonella enterica subsp. enterica]|uniref:Respiratory nitrate reductase 2 subunit alpha n=1 Tax=Salmonella enterica I TaxID=59201 RepID=A0A447MSL6_SALET|nr:respiratory nitrate reductase 2 subunit alpha [Salmonella enterica subsp. enterica]